MDKTGVTPIIRDYLSSTCGPTTYQATYRRSRCNALPPIKYSQPPAFELKAITPVKVRQFPIIPLGPHRRLELEIAGPARPALAPGLGTKDVDTER